MTSTASIISTSGAGVSFEARVAAVYLSAMLARSSGPGDEPAKVIEHVALQRTEGAPGFDDIHLRHSSPTGITTSTYMQVKRTLTGDRSDEAFRRPVAAAARALDAGGGEGSSFRIVASESAFSPRDVDRARRTACLSDDGQDFWRRWRKRGGSSPSERKYTDAVQWVVQREIGRPDEDLAWKLIARMGLVVVDADQEGSQAAMRAVDLLAGSLVSGERAEAVQLSETLCLFAEDAAKVAGGVDRSRLIGELTARYRLTPSRSVRPCLDRLAADAASALVDIRDDVAGVKVARSCLIEDMTAALQGVAGLRVIGRAGTGKSAVLRRIAEQRRGQGAGLIVLKHDRLVARSWAEQAQLLGLVTPLAQLVDELAAGGSGLFVIDGLDRMLDAGFAGLVREVGTAIQASATAGNWRCLASSRDADGTETPIREPMLDAMATWVVGAPDEQDLVQLARAFPHLAPILARRGYAELNRNLFFIDQMARHPSISGASSELDLMRAWAGRGGAEVPALPSRDSTLRSLGEARLIRPHGPLPKVGDGEALARLASERTLKIAFYRDVVTFEHDVYEDWAVARALDARRDEVPSLLEAAGQPLAWMRAVRLVAEIALDVDGAAGWRALHDRLRADDDLDPIWRRLTLTAMLHSPRAPQLLEVLEPTLLEDGAALMGDLIATLVSLEVRPHPAILSSAELDHLPPASRRMRAQRLAIPRSTPWHAFMGWSVERWSDWPKALIPALARMTLTWLRLLPREERITGRAVRHCIAWLRELDALDSMPFDMWEERRDGMREMGAERFGSHDPVRESLRLAMAMGASAAVDDVRLYVEGVIGSEKDGSALVEAPGEIPCVLPARFVDLVVSKTVMGHDLDAPLAHALERGDGLRDLAGFFPASPTRGGFDLLFATDEDEALRLLSALSEAAAAVWRRRQARKGRTPRPLRISGAGLYFELWGDEHVFKWSRGLIGPHVLGSLLLAADGWLASAVAAGRPIGPLCAKLLASSRLVASAGLCLAAATDRADSHEALGQVLTLLAQPRLWNYDLRRFLDDRSGSAFGIGWRPGDEHAYHAAMGLRERRVGQHAVVEGLVLPILLSEDETLQRDLGAAVAAWRVDDLASFDEELVDADSRADLEGELASWKAKVDPVNWRVGPGPQEGTLSIEYVAPGSHAERAGEAREGWGAFQAASQLFPWAFGQARGGVTPAGQTFAEALPIAKSLDEPDLFDSVPILDAASSLTAQGVAAVAAAVAVHGTVDLIEAEAAWLRSVFKRAAAIDHASNPIFCEETVLGEDAKASAARGLGALTMRGLSDAEMVRTWLDLVSSPFRDIAKAALEPAAANAASRPSACAAALSVCSESMIYGWQPLEAGFEDRLRQSRARRGRIAVDRAVAVFDRGYGPPDLRMPRPITEPFAAYKASNPCAGDPSSQFDPYRAAAVWSGFDLGAACEVPTIRDLLVAYLSDALLWYGSFLGFQDGQGGRGGLNRHPEWESTLGAMVGALAYLIAPPTALERLVGPASSIPDQEARSDVLGHVLDGLGRAIVSGNRTIHPDLAAIWRAASRPLFEAARQEDGRFDPEGMALTAAAFAFYDLPVFPEDWPRARELQDLLDEWVVNCAAYRFSASTLRRVIVQAGAAFVPSPGLGWLARLMDAHRSEGRDYWLSSAGTALGEILLHLWARCSERERRANIAAFRAAAARLADHGVVSAAELLPEVATVQANA